VPYAGTRALARVTLALALGVWPPGHYSPHARGTHAHAAAASARLSGRAPESRMASAAPAPHPSGEPGPARHADGPAAASEDQAAPSGRGGRSAVVIQHVIAPTEGDGRSGQGTARRPSASRMLDLQPAARNAPAASQPTPRDIPAEEERGVIRVGSAAEAARGWRELGGARGSEIESRNLRSEMMLLQRSWQVRDAEPTALLPATHAPPPQASYL